jgi:hypothetical protein
LPAAAFSKTKVEVRKIGGFSEPSDSAGSKPWPIIRVDGLELRRRLRARRLGAAARAAPVRSDSSSLCMSRSSSKPFGLSLSKPCPFPLPFARKDGPSTSSGRNGEGEGPPLAQKRGDDPDDADHQRHAARSRIIPALSMRGRAMCPVAHAMALGPVPEGSMKPQLAAQAAGRARRIGSIPVAAMMPATTG